MLTSQKAFYNANKFEKTLHYLNQNYDIVDVYVNNELHETNMQSLIDDIPYNFYQKALMTLIQHDKKLVLIINVK